MSVRKRTWRDKHGRRHTRWMIHVEHTWPDGRKQSIRKVSPVQTRRGAEAYEREVRKLLASGSWKEGDRKQTPTLEGFAEEFLAYQKTLNKPSELANKEMILRVHLLPVFGKRRLDQIDERAIDAYKVEKLDQVTRRGKSYNPNTVNKHLKLLARILRVARKWKLISDVPEVGLLKARKTDFDFLTFEEADAFIAAAKQHAPHWHPFVVVALRTGLRIGELIALRWREDIDLARGRVTVQQSYNPHNGFTSTKNDKIRELPLTWDAVAALEAQRELVDVDSELVFPGADGKVLSANKTNEVLAEISEAAGIRRIHNHCTRHSFASHAVMRGIPIRQVQEWLGHGSIVVTMRYAHLARGLGDELIRRLAPQPAADLQHTDDPQNSDPSEFPPLHPSNNTILH
ncbi:Tyrosine recombinase XerC [Enhygromyxa salina]|uniref:Tyrosine recombinase XerC n=2 Tax=Enhygromyxa salina TaxID=215803 RepID=A0A2S9YHW9_9BACT|nr:Tyrosine recombinase XerC [Enhygromyxa salina]